MCIDRIPDIRRRLPLEALCNSPLEAEQDQQIASINIVVDKFHFPGHVDPWCHEHCNPYKFESLQKASLHMYIQLPGFSQECHHIILKT